MPDDYLVAELNLDVPLPENFEASWTIVHNANFGSFGFAIGPKPRRTPRNYQWVSPTIPDPYLPPQLYGPSPYMDSLNPVLNGPVAYGIIRAPDIDYRRNVYAEFNWKRRAELLPIVIQETDKGAPTGWHTDWDHNGTDDAIYNTSSKAWASRVGQFDRYFLRPDRPYRVNLARVNGTVYLLVYEIGNPQNWVWYSTDNRAEMLSSAGYSPVPIGSGEKLPATPKDQLWFWRAAFDMATDFGIFYERHGTPKIARARIGFDAAIDDFILRDLGHDNPLEKLTTPEPGAILSELTRSYLKI